MDYKVFIASFVLSTSSNILFTSIKGTNDYSIMPIKYLPERIITIPISVLFILISIIILVITIKKLMEK